MSSSGSVGEQRFSFEFASVPLNKCWLLFTLYITHDMESVREERSSKYKNISWTGGMSEAGADEWEGEKRTENTYRFKLFFAVL